ncbi:MAG: hypothetical protein M1834_001262 [Cirrosporium novae-zelandiae]|nr:MAG: hypothetical protein M1834_001262 [Cirrosporium novae-zelandiae]
MEQSPKDQEMTDAPQKATYKSWKKKYRKMKLNFDDAMNESSSLFKNNNKAMDIARRLKEQNNQLVDLLDELNESSDTNAACRYELDDTNPEANDSGVGNDEEFSIADYSPAAADAALREAKADVDAGDMSPNSYKRLQETISRTYSKPRRKRLAALMHLPHTRLEETIAILPEDIGAENPVGYLTPQEEEKYLADVDESLNNGHGYPKFDSRSSFTRTGDKRFETDKDLAMRNPVSVHNWLRKHQPQVFLQDHEKEKEKEREKEKEKEKEKDREREKAIKDHDVVSEKSTTRPSNTRGSKRASNVTPKAEQDMYDEDGILMDIAPTSATTRGKRKRDDEPYRPKGGSSRPSRKKKDDGAGNPKKSRRSMANS